MEKSQEDQEQKTKRLDGTQRKEMKGSGVGVGRGKAAGEVAQTNAAEGWRVEVTWTESVTAPFVLFVRIWASFLLEKLWETAGFTFQKSFLRILI